MNNCENYKKPPIGLRPKEIWLRMREGEIMEAMRRYRKADKDIPVGWIDELLAIDNALDDIKEGSV